MSSRPRQLALAAALLGALLLPGAPAPAREAPAITFDRIDLEIGGRITEIVVHDLDGDKRKDLLVVRGREALIFFQGPGGKWSSEANQRFRFHPRAILFDVGDVTGDGNAEIVLLQKRSLRAYKLRRLKSGVRLYGLRPVKLATVRSFFTRPDRKEVRRKRLLQDVDGDGKLDGLVPRRDGFAILRNEGKGQLGKPVNLHAPPTAMLNPGTDRLSSRLFASYWFPNPNIVQWDAKGPREIVLTREEKLHVYKAPRPGAMPVQPLAIYSIPDQKRFSRSAEKPLELDFTMPLLVRDLDGDGRVDVSSTHVGKGTTRVYRNTTNPERAFRRPVRSIRTKGVTFLSYYADLQGDGRLDLILPRMDQISVWSILKVLITKSVPIEMLVYYQRKDSDLYGREPDLVRDLEIPLGINSEGDSMRFGTTVVATVDGDYDGDGRKDLLYRTDSDTLSFYRGLPGPTLEEEPSLTATVPDIEKYRFCLPKVVDLDGDGRDDVILRYLSWDRNADRISILRARKGRVD